MTTTEVIAIGVGGVGFLWGIIQTLLTKYTNRQEEDVKTLASKHEEIYKALIETQKQNTESAHGLTRAVERLTSTVTHMEAQAADRHTTMTSRMNDLHDAQELIRLRVHWVINKLTVVKFHLEKIGAPAIGDWEAP